MTMRGDILELTITHLAGLGDGVAAHEGVPVFVPLTCAGDTVRAQVVQAGREHHRARLLEVLEPSPQRADPPCPHFGACGGCTLQHLDAAAYDGFKHAIAVDAARALGVEGAVVKPLFRSGAASRRRAEVKVTVEQGEVRLGFLAARSHDVIATPECKVVDAAIANAMETWRAALQHCGKPARITAIHFTHAENGLDVLLQCSAAPKPADIQLARGHAAAQGVVRLGVQVGQGEPQWLRLGEPFVQLGGVTVELPPAAFLQATRASQDAMIAEVAAQCGEATTVADIYCGIGTFSLPLAQAGHRVLAYEGSGEAVTALFNAARRHGLEERLSVHARDLYAQPLTTELRGVEVAVINPPRNGALPQCEALAASGVGRVVMVSCNPATFIRDGKALCGAGFRLVSLLPVDQFTWSHHLELVGTFCRNAQ